MLPVSGNSLRLTLLAVMAMGLSACMSGTRPVAETQAPVAPEASTDDAATVATADAAPQPPVEIPAAATAAFDRALSMMAAERWDEAELELDLLILEYPSLPGPYVNLALIYRRDGRDDQAQALLERALERAPEHPAANNELGVILREQGDFERAEAAYRQAIAADADHALAHYNLAVLLDLYLKRESDALSHYEAYQRLTPEDDDPMVGIWVADLRRRLGVTASAQQLAQENGQ